MLTQSSVHVIISVVDQGILNCRLISDMKMWLLSDDLFKKNAVAGGSGKWSLVIYRGVGGVGRF